MSDRTRPSSPPPARTARRPWVVPAAAALAAAALLPSAASAQVPTTPPADDPHRGLEVAYQSGRFPQAITQADRMLRSNPNDHVALYLRGSAKIEQGLIAGTADLVRGGIADARQAIEKGGSTNPRYYLPYLYGMTNLSMIEDRPDHAEVAIGIAEQVLAAQASGGDPETRSNLLYQRALARQFLGRTDDAVADFDAAVAVNPQHIAARLRKAELLARVNRPEEARRAFDATVDAYPDNALVYNNRGDFLRSLGERDAAVQDFTRAIEKDPTFGYAYTNRGVTLLEGGKADAAINDFDRSLELQPDQPVVLGMRGNAQLVRGDLEAAIRDQRAAVRAAPQNPVTHSDLAFALFFAEQYQDALAEFDEALDLAPQFRHLHPWRFETLAALRRDPSADPGVRAALENDGNAVDWVVRLIQYQTGSIDADTLRGKVSDTPDVADAQLTEANYFIGRKRLREGDPGGALEAFKSALNFQLTRLSAYRGAKIAVARMGG